LTPAGAVICVSGTMLVAGLWGFTLDRLFPADPHPYLDCLVTSLILLAQLLSSLKKWECWIVWLLVNITQIILHVSVGNVFMPIVCALYLVNGIWSLWSWYKLYKKKA
jgi:nicotinamide mononucleotide transporter